METLGYGTHLIIDGFKADAGALEDAQTVEHLLQAIAAQLEPHSAAAVLLEACEAPVAGMSGTVVKAEAYATFHTFLDLRAVCLSVFSRRGLELAQISAQLETHYGVRRFESHLKNHSKTVAKDAEQRRRTLLGDRQYAALRLKDQAIL